MTSSYAFRTWAWAHALHPVAWIGWAMLYPGNLSIPMTALLTCFFGLFISIPAIYTFWGIVDLIARSPFSVVTKFVLWVIIVPISLHMCVCLTCLGLSKGFFIVMLEFTIPAMIATLLSIIIRFPQFIELIKEVNHKYDKQIIFNHRPSA